jgi:hypothetical protein
MKQQLPQELIDIIAFYVPYEIALKITTIFVLQKLGRNPSHYYSSWSNFAKKGNLYGIEWLHYHDIEGCSEKVMDLACEGGHVEIVKWLHKNRTEGCTKRAMDMAARYGHMELLEFLHENRSEGCTVDAMDLAAMYGRMNILQFLHENRTEGCTVEQWILQPHTVT